MVGPSLERPGAVCVECLADVGPEAGAARVCACGLPLCGRQSCLAAAGPNHGAECQLLVGLRDVEEVEEGEAAPPWDTDTLHRILDDLLPLRQSTYSS